MDSSKAYSYLAHWFSFLLFYSEKMLASFLLLWTIAFWLGFDFITSLEL